MPRRAAPLACVLLAALAGGASAQNPTPEPDPEVFVVVEQMPELLGGLESLHVTYPEAERRAGVEGRVMVRFIVNEDGSVSDIQVVRGVSPGLDSAAVAAIREARFRPGVQRGRPVRVQFSLPISFRLTENPPDGPPPSRLFGDDAPPPPPPPAAPPDVRPVLLTPERAPEPEGGWGRLAVALPPERLADGDSTYIFLHVDAEGAWEMIEMFGGARSHGVPPHADLVRGALGALHFRPAQFGGEAVETVAIIVFAADWSGSRPYLRAAPFPIPLARGVASGVYLSVSEAPRPPGGLPYFLSHVPYPTDVPPDTEDPTSVIMRFVVDAEGRVTLAEPLLEGPSPFSRAAAAALHQATFTPGRQDGRAVPVILLEEFVFTRPVLQRG